MRQVSVKPLWLSLLVKVPEKSRTVRTETLVGLCLLKLFITIHYSRDPETGDE